MKPTLVVGDTITADGSEQDIFGSVMPGNYRAYVDLTNMNVGDTLVVSVYGQVLEGGATTIVEQQTYTPLVTGFYTSIAKTDIHTQDSKDVNAVRVTIQQTAGTNRVYDFKVLAL